MARTRKSGQETLDQKIELAKQKVIKTKAAYEKAVDELQVLLDKKKALQTQDLMKAISESDKTFEEIIQFIKG
ncbi:MAG: hypothetical protein Q4D24_14510 [Erysipelotrichaceae bacterium]|nr:hypothetical protein [Erysipelotrichaceae bacterium]